MLVITKMSKKVPCPVICRLVLGALYGLLHLDVNETLQMYALVVDIYVYIVVEYVHTINPLGAIVIDRNLDVIRVDSLLRLT